MAFHNLMEVIGIIFLLLVIGFTLARMGFVRERDTGVISNLIISVTAPALIFNGILSSFDLEFFLVFPFMPLLAVLNNLIIIGLAVALSKIYSFESESKKDIFIICSSFSNAVFMGLPVIIALYGNKGIGPVFLYDLGLNFLLWSVGLSIISKVGRTKPKSIIKGFINPPMVAMAASFLMGVLQLQPPSFLMNFTGMLGDVTTPLAILCIGMTMGLMRFDRKSIDGSMVLLIIIKLIIAPTLMIIMLSFFQINELIKNVLILQTAMPTMVFAAILARKYDKEYNYAATSVFLTTFFSLLSIPLIVYIITYII